MTLEIITLALDDTLEAEAFGADRVELVSNMSEGGLTPSNAVIEAVLKHAKIPVQIMVRPHGDGFVYDTIDWQHIETTINIIRSFGGKRIVIGAINESKQIDVPFLDRIVKVAEDFDMTFHRAFDEVKDQIEAYKILTKYKQIKRILTSGGEATAQTGQKNLRDLVQLSKQLNGPKILVGSGVSPDNLAGLKASIGADEFHIGSAVRIEKSFANGLDPSKIKTALNILN